LKYFKNFFQKKKDFFKSIWYRVSIEKIESPHDVRRIIQLGKSLPLYCGGSGKALLAFLTDEEIDKIIQKEKFIPFGPNTITDPVKLEEHLK